MTGHGFRSMVSTLLHKRGWNHQVIERQLAHAERNAVSAAYNFAEHLPGSFATDPATNPRPAAACFPKDANWNMTFTQATGELAGSCVNPPIPAANFCAP